MGVRRSVLPLLAALVAGAVQAQAPAPAKGPAYDASRSVYQRRILPAESGPKVDWEARITELLKEEPGDVILTAVGDMIFNEQITHLADPEHRQLWRILQEADISYGNLEFSLNDRPDLQRPFYNFRAPKTFTWELAALGINLVSMANNHALDFGPDGLRECLRNLDLANINHAGAGTTLAEAHAPATFDVQSRKTKFALLSYMRYWTAKYRSRDPQAPSLATIDPAVILNVQDGKVVEVEGPLASDLRAMEDDVVLARRREDYVMVSLHNHDRSHHRAFGIQDTTPANDEIMYHKAVEAGADLVLGTGPHMLRGIEILKGKPIFYSLSNFIYQYRTPDKIPVDLIHQRDGEIERPTNVSVWDRRDPRVIFEGVVARVVLNGTAWKRIQLIPFTIDAEGPLYGVPRLSGGERGKEIIRRIQDLSRPYGTVIADRGWYGEILP